MRIFLVLVLLGLIVQAARRSAARSRARSAPPLPQAAMTVRSVPSPRSAAPIGRRHKPVVPSPTTNDLAAPRGYLLGGGTGAGVDRMAAAMTAMSGPGICTPPRR